MAGTIGQILAKKGTRMATKHFLDKQLADNSHPPPAVVGTLTSNTAPTRKAA